MRTNILFCLMLVLLIGNDSSASAAASLSIGTISYETTVVKDESITITSLVTASSVSGTLTVDVTLTDNSGLFTIPTATQQVQFTTDGTQSVTWTITASSTGTSATPFSVRALGDDGGTTASGTSSTVLNVKDRPALSVAISKSVSSVAAGGTVTLGYLVSNSAATGAADATNVAVNLTLPTGFSLTSGTSSYSLGSISAQGSTSGTWVVTADSPSTTNTFTISVTSTIPGGTVSTTTSVSATTLSSSSTSGGNSGSGGGGGGGSSGENYTNIGLVEKYDLQISKDTLTSFRFTHEKNPIMFVNITGNTSSGVITSSIEVLKNTSTLVKIAPDGLVYINANIWVGTSGYATPKNIKQAVIKFRVDNSWMSANGVSGSDIVLVKWDGSTWIRLETSEGSKDHTYTYFEAKTQSFSPFAIIGLKGEKSTQVYSAVAAETSAKPTSNPSNPNNVPTKGIPGFEIVTAITAIYLLKRR